MLQTAKEIDKYSKDVSENYQYLETQKRILDSKVAEGLLDRKSVV